MIFGVLLAGGVGSRMGNVEKPKQYMNIGDRPIIIHTIEKFFVNDKFEKILVLCSGTVDFTHQESYKKIFGGDRPYCCDGRWYNKK